MNDETKDGTGFGALRIHWDTIEKLKARKRIVGVALKRDVTWDEFMMMLLNSAER